MKSHEEHLRVLMDFVNDNNRPSKYAFSKEENIHYLRYAQDFASDLVTDACNKNKRIHSELIAVSIEEISAIWEVC